MLQLSKHFSLDEATTSQTADRLGVDNQPDLATLVRMRLTASGMELVRSELGDLPIDISSWYRSPRVNRSIGSRDTSQHPKGEAVDFKCPAFGNPLQIVDHLRKSGIKFDQLILEFWSGGHTGWVHVSFCPKPRRQVLIIDRRGARAFG